MKKKSHRAIPDFSRQPAKGKSAPLPATAAPVKSPAPKAAPAVKPQATSAKFGRRGQ